jgi:cold-inducible RNA-binding protein
MLARLFVGNLSWSVTDAELGDLFSAFGEVQSARVITDRETGRSRGFGFVEIETDSVADVIRAVDGRELNGRPVRVNEAEARNSGGGGGGRRSGGGGSDRDRGNNRW